jgi:hypothetical protein
LYNPQLLVSEKFQINLENDVYGWYATDKNNVYYRGEKITGADLPSFKVVTCEPATTCYAKDSNNVYHYGEILKDADPATFEITPDNPERMRDKNYSWSSWTGELLK